MPGQLDWAHQGSATNAFIVQAAIEKKIYTEVRDTGVFMDMELLKENDPNGNGMQDAKVQLTGNTGAIWTQTNPSGDEARFTLARNIKGTAGYGDSPVRAGDAKAYMHYNIFVNEVDSELIPIPGRNAQRRIRNVIPEFKSDTIKSVGDWHIEEKDYAFHCGIFNGADDGQRLSPSTVPGALGKDLGAGVGVDCPPEILYTPIAGATRATVPSTGPRTTAYRDNVISALAALSADGTKFFNRQSVNAIAQLANDHKIKKVGGANWDYELIVDTALMRNLMDFSGSATDKNLLQLLKTAQQGQGIAGQKTLDTRGAVELDGCRIIPDKGMDKFRVYGNGLASGAGGNGINAASPILRYGDGSRDRRGKSFTGADYKIGFAVLMGSGALLQAVSESIELIEVEDDFKKGWGVYGRLTRGVSRGFWESKDGTAKTATEGWLQQSMIVFAFNINTSAALA
jgi:hypothetical protein